MHTKGSLEFRRKRKRGEAKFEGLLGVTRVQKTDSMRFGQQVDSVSGVELQVDENLNGCLVVGDAGAKVEEHLIIGQYRALSFQGAIAHDGGSCFVISFWIIICRRNEFDVGLRSVNGAFKD